MDVTTTATPAGARVVIRDRVCEGFTKAMAIRGEDPEACIVVLDHVPPREYGGVAGRCTWDAGMARTKARLASQYGIEHRQGVEVTAVNHASRSLEIREHTGRTYREYYDAFLP